MDSYELKYIKSNHYESYLTTNKSIIETSLKKFLQQKCIESGSTLQGRIKSFNNVTGAKQKSCIYIDARTFLIPDRSIKSTDVLLINYWMIHKIRKIDNHNTEVLFKDNSRIAVACDIRTLNKQFERCALYLSKML